MLPSEEFLLAALLRTSQEQIKEALCLTDSYEEVKIPKNNGRGKRILLIPSAPLKQIQQKILRKILKKLEIVWLINIFGAQPGTSYIDHARGHLGNRFIFQLDIKDAFYSVDIKCIEKLIYEMLWSAINNVVFSLYLHMFNWSREIPLEAIDSGWIEYTTHEENGDCLKEPSVSLFYPLLWFAQGSKERLAESLLTIIMKLVTCQGVLPQGAPTSPLLFHLYLMDCGLFNKLIEFRGIKITAYVDNIVFSSPGPISAETRARIIEIVEQFLPVNRKKTRYQDARQEAPLLTGLRLIKQDGQNKVVLSKRTVRRLRGLIYRAVSDPTLRKRVQGHIASLRPIYGHEIFLPPQLSNPLKKLQAAIAAGH